jgi:hypothetical protein
MQQTTAFFSWHKKQLQLTNLKVGLVLEWEKNV